MRKKLIAGNWKMNGDIQSVSKLLQSLVDGLPSSKNYDCVVFPAFIHLAQTASLLRDTDVRWGAQTLSHHQNGAHTGEVSADMLTDLGCHYTLVGHSERRQNNFESDNLVAQKFIAALNAGIRPILCVGETAEQYEAGKTDSVLEQQLQAILSHCGGVEAFANAVIAYEPVWAIGSGKSATPEYAEQIHSKIRNDLAAGSQSIAQSVQILYGGSVKSSNAERLLSMENIDGALVGGASLNSVEFLDICRLAAEESMSCNS